MTKYAFTVRSSFHVMETCIDNVTQLDLESIK